MTLLSQQGKHADANGRHECWELVRRGAQPQPCHLPAAPHATLCRRLQHHQNLCLQRLAHLWGGEKPHRPGSGIARLQPHKNVVDWVGVRTVQRPEDLSRLR